MDNGKFKPPGTSCDDAGRRLDANAQSSIRMPHLTRVSLSLPRSARGFPFDVPVIRALKELDLDAPLTYFVGENGSGKSTLLEALAIAARLPTVGSESAERDPTLEPQRALARKLKLSWTKRTHRGFFLRAEDFFGYARSLSKMRSEFEGRLQEIEVEYRDRSAYAKSLAMMPARSSLAEMENRYGADLDARSHGQSFLKLFESRFVPGGLYLLDEPEAPLSPQSQLALMVMLNYMLRENAQFVIATHSPILLAFPGARIYDFDRAPLAPVRYEELDHVALTREFLSAPERYLTMLFRD
jgi:predicted ATPase